MTRSTLLVAGGGTVFAGLGREGDLPTAFRALLLAVTVVALRAALASLRVGGLVRSGAAVREQTPPAFQRSNPSSGGTA
jgi:hypothetical protein